MQRFARLPRRHVWAEFKTTVFDDRVHERIPIFDSHKGQPARTNRATSAVLANQIICHISLSEQDTNVSDTFSIL